MKRLLGVVGARPNMMKMAPLVEQFRGHGGADFTLVHTGQHYDASLSKVFFEELGLPEPDVNLGVGSGSHAWQLAQVMDRFEPVLASARPDLLIVVGDVNSTLATALVGATAGIPVAHVEAGLRSFDPTMPEELNRRLTDAVSSQLFTPSRDADENLRNEGVAADRIYFVGNVMVDTLLRFRQRAAEMQTRIRLQLNDPYGLVTLHRPSSVDDRGSLKDLLDALERVSRSLPLVFPAHPRTTKRLQEFGFWARIPPGVRMAEPMGYLDFLNLMMGARLVLTDSGGIQEETSVLGVPCLTLRTSTERPVTLSEGTNTLVGTDPPTIVSAAEDILDSGGRTGRIPELWDGRASQRIASIVLEGSDAAEYRLESRS